jgi:hypothetical protein
VRLQKEKAYEEAQRQRQLVIQSKYRLEEEMAIQVARREKEKREQEEEALRCARLAAVGGCHLVAEVPFSQTSAGALL